MPLVSRLGFVIAPLTPHIPDVLLCHIDKRTQLVSVIGALDSGLAPVSVRNVSRWLFLLARSYAGARPIRPSRHVFTRCLDEIGSETFPCDSPHQLPPGCYALFDLDGSPFQYPIGRTRPRPTFSQTRPIWTVPDDGPRAVYRITNPVPEPFASQARERDQGLCCFTGLPSNYITWIIPPFLALAVTPPGFSLESCLSSNNVFTILPELLTAYQNNFIAVDPQAQLLHTLVLLAHRNNFHRMAIASWSLTHFNMFICSTVSARCLLPDASGTLWRGARLVSSHGIVGWSNQQ
ncbi:hypothetical protein B0H14DRAFT_3046357, partial [Mycena olivaceomarginata]